MTWAGRLAERRQNVAKGPGDLLPKLTKGGFVSFVSDPVGRSGKFAQGLTGIRDRLHELARLERLPTTLVDERLAVLDEYDGEDDDALRFALVAWSMERPGACSHCGPVWLAPTWPSPASVCPWCFRRKAGKPFPRPR